MFTIRLTRGRRHQEILSTHKLSVPDLPLAIQGARRFLGDAQQSTKGPDGYVILDETGEQVASDWTGKLNA